MSYNTKINTCRETTNFEIMERLADKTVEELKQIREEYVKKYIGDFDKPINYARTLLHLDRLIMAKG